MYTIKQIQDKVIRGHVLDALKNIPDNSVDCILTSPPYYGLRSYGQFFRIWGGRKDCEHEWNSFVRKGITGGYSEKVKIKGVEHFQHVDDELQQSCNKCGAWYGELGREPRYQMFIDNLVSVFMECARVLKSSGALWINIGDSYSGSNQGAGAGHREGVKQMTNLGTNFTKEKGYKSPLASTGLPRKSLMCIPDRLKIALVDNGLVCRNEIIWHKVNQMPQSTKDRFTVDYEKFYFFTKSDKYYFKQQLEAAKYVGDDRGSRTDSGRGTGYNSVSGKTGEFRNKRSVWSINTKPNRENHFATFNPELISTPINACCPEGGIVLDPFFGSGTTGLVAVEQKKHFIGIELNPEYVDISIRRLGLDKNSIIECVEEV